jgi:hypothetical protein
MNMQDTSGDGLGRRHMGRRRRKHMGALPTLVGRKRGKKSRARKACIVASGRKKGKLKEGWRFNKRGGCVRAKGH